MSVTTSFTAAALQYNILYVQDVALSEAFYQKLLQLQAVESSPGFALFIINPNLKLGLWRSASVVPAATAAGGCELGFTLTTPEQVDQCHAAWQAAGITILQAPTTMDFGYTFVACDPDGHRLRVFALSL